MTVELNIPGLVDLQVNGFMGVDFSSPDLTEEPFIWACQRLLRRGTAAFLPTVITSPVEVYERNLPLIAKALARPEFKGKLLGLHLEGPFISPQPGAVGAHHPAWVRPPDLDLLKQLFDWAGYSVRILTLAAEFEGADTLARWASEQGALVSLGHTLANSSDLDRLSEAGAKALTHLGNGLPQMLPKFANPIWAGLADDRYTAMFIADGHHLPDGVLRLMIHAKGVARSVIVSDAAPIAGLPPGNYTTLGNEVILEESGRLFNPAKGCLVGSSATLLECMNHLASQGYLSLEDLLALGFHNPLRLLGIDAVQIPPAEERFAFDERRRQFIQ